MITVPKSFPAYFALFRLTLRQLFWSRRVLLILIGCVLLLAVTVLFRIYERGASSVNSFIPYITFLGFGFLTSLSAIFYGSAIISDEIDGRGLTFLQMRPLPKSMILLTKFAAYMVGTVVIVGLSHLLLMGIMQTHPKLKQRLLVIVLSFRYTGSFAISLFVYGTFAVLLSVRFKHPVLWGLLFVFGWEQITQFPPMPIGIKRISLSHYLMTLFPEFKLRSDVLDGLLGENPPDWGVAIIVIGLLTAGAMWLAIRIFKEREYLM